MSAPEHLPQDLGRLIVYGYQERRESHNLGDMLESPQFPGQVTAVTARGSSTPPRG